MEENKETKDAKGVAWADAPTALYAALHKAQGRMDAVRKNGTNPHFSSRYATLDEIWNTVKPILNDCGLVVFCTVEKDGMEREMVTHLAEVRTGQEISCSFPIVAGANTPQAIGSALTYARRYTLSALCEIVTGDGADDDGEAATGPSAPKSPYGNAAQEWRRRHGNDMAAFAALCKSIHPGKASVAYTPEDWKRVADAIRAEDERKD